MLKVKMRSTGNVRILDLQGRLVLGETDILKDAVKRLLAEGHDRLLINLKKVTMMDSAGVGELAACRKRSEDKKATIKLLSSIGHFPLSTDLLIGLMFPDRVFDEELKAVGSF